MGRLKTSQPVTLQMQADLACELLFVYGTLRRGGSNDIAGLVPAARFVADARLRGRLFDLGAYPTLIIDAQADWVRGEIYRVPAHGWLVLDALEHAVTPARPDGEYFRVICAVEQRDGPTLDCQVYVANPAVTHLDTRVEHGDWMTYTKARSGA